MKKKVFSMIALLFMAATGAMAQTYSVTLKEGTEDADKWTITPKENLTGDGTETVTITYTGTKKVASVTAVKKSANPYANAKLGDLFYSDGTFSTTLEEGKTPIGVIAYLDQEGTDDDGITEKSNGAGHGLVLCLKNAASVIKWSTEKVSKFSGQEVTSVDGLKRTANVSGYTNTATLTVDDATAAKYPAAAAAKNYAELTAPTGTTGWFLPSAQQWVKMETGLGALEESSITWGGGWYDSNHTAADKWENAIKKAGDGNYDSMTSFLCYWSSTENFADEAVMVFVDATDTGEDYGFGWGVRTKDSTDDEYRVRPVLAF